MAIGFARLEFVKRSAGKNACAKAAYNSRSKIHFIGHEHQPEKIYSWLGKEKPAYHEILLPSNADEKYRNPETLWNAVEKNELRKNSQVQTEVVLALPDDKSITIEDKIYLTKTFINDHFVAKGFSAQVDIHQPQSSKNNEEKENHNWHVHILIPTRRFAKNGLDFESHKPRDLMPVVRNGRVVSGPNWGKEWAIHQNHFFEEKGLELRVDPTGVVSQKHLGPIRFRQRAVSLFEEQAILEDLNAIESKDPAKILEKITETKSVFTQRDVDRYLDKHVQASFRNDILRDFWEQKEIVALIDPKTSKQTGKFTTQTILKEESLILKISSHLVSKKALNSKAQNMSHLTSEQQTAYVNIISGKRLSCIEGHAGTGKSFLLSLLKDTYEKSGYIVRAMGPDNATTNVLKEKGFRYSDNIYQFLYQHHYKKKKIAKSKEVWIIDEAGKLGNRPLLELLKIADTNNIQVILSGSSSQLKSVDRGGMFQLFCKKYGCEYLQNIQRQKDTSQREIAKKLASGKMSEAINLIYTTGGFQWSQNKIESLESLVHAWSKDRAAFPFSSSLMIAHTNAEVKALNETARQYLKERGEIGSDEYCFGKVSVSEGDKIEFRKKDRDLNLSNGDVGIITKITPNRIQVQIKKDKKVSFNPNEYTHFQLAYATTYHRSQGRTLDRVYIQHSPYMNKEMFYVGLTRHVRKAYCFVSREDASCLSELKRQAYTSQKQEITLDFITQEHIENLKREQEIKDLKQSDSLFSKFKGFSYHALDKIGLMVEQRTDLKPDKSFYSYKEISLNRPKIAKEPVKQESQEVPQKESDWKKLSKEKQSILKKYFEASDKASVLYTIVQSEQATKHSSEWMAACRERNQAAYQVTQLVSEKELKNLFHKKNLEILKDRSHRYELVQQSKSCPAIKIEKNLLDKIEPLLHRLFPEGPTRKERNGLRFGSKGSLKVISFGDKAGSFYDFEKGEGGGLLKLIQNRENLDFKEAKFWAENFLGTSQTYQTPSQYQIRTSPASDWISLQPEKENKAPSLDKISPYLAKHYAGEARYTYRDTTGNVLFHTLRLVDGDKKIVLPLSYGYQRESGKIPKWSLKGYLSDGKKPIYNQHLLSQNKNDKVLIVEGEKTADAANQLLANEGFTCISWLGGSSSVSKVDWEPLFGRDVIIWPDNDHAGCLASDGLCKELRQMGVKSLKMVDLEYLEKNFPNKWDLADQLPKEQNLESVKDLILSGREKAIGLEQLRSLAKEGSHCLHSIFSIQNELWDSLEQQYGAKTWKIKDTVLKEAKKTAFKQPSNEFEPLLCKQIHLELNAKQLESEFEK